MPRYNIYYQKYSILARDYIPYVKVVYTDDVYHEIGAMICKSLERIQQVRYTEPRASKEDCEKLWADSGYRKLSENLWVKDNRSDAEEKKAEPFVRYTTKYDGKNCIPLKNAICGIDLPRWSLKSTSSHEDRLEGDAADRLAAYEDIGLTPEEIKEKLKR